MSLSSPRRLRIVGQVERADAVGASWSASKNALRRAQAYPGCLRQRPAHPVGGSPGGADSAKSSHPLHRGGRPWRFAGFARLVARQPVHALGHEPLLPAPDHRLGLAGSPHDLRPCRSRRQSPEMIFGAPNMLLRRVAIANDFLKPTAILRRNLRQQFLLS